LGFKNRHCGDIQVMWWAAGEEWGLGFRPISEAWQCVTCLEGISAGIRAPYFPFTSHKTFDIQAGSSSDFTAHSVFSFEMQRTRRSAEKEKVVLCNRRVSAITQKL
jgi:hypothetical protein